MPTLRVLSSLALKGLLESLQTGRLELSFDATQAIVPLVRAGEKADVLILIREAMDELQADGTVARAWVLAGSGVGVAVRAGAARPDIDSVDSLRETLLAAESVAHSKVGASGIYFAALLERMGIADRLKKRVVIDKGPVGLAVAAGEAELGVQQLCELAPVRGIDIVGPLPGPLQKLTCFSAGIPAAAANPDGAVALVELLRSKLSGREGVAVLRAAGFEPAPEPPHPLRR